MVGKVDLRLGQDLVDDRLRQPALERSRLEPVSGTCLERNSCFQTFAAKLTFRSMLRSHISLVCEGLPGSGRRIIHVGPFSALEEDGSAHVGKQRLT